MSPIRLACHQKSSPTNTAWRSRPTASASWSAAVTRSWSTRGAGLGSALTDDAFEQQGAEIVADADAVFADTELVLKVKEPQPQEVARLRPGQALFTYLHLAAAPELASALCDTDATCIAYETVEVDGRLPLLAPMSEVAGKIASQAGAFALGRPNGGRGILLVQRF